MDAKIIVGAVAGTAAVIGLGLIIHHIVTTDNQPVNDEETINCKDGVEIVKAIKKLAAQANVELSDDKLLVMAAGILVLPSVDKLTYKQLRDALNHLCENNDFLKDIKF